MERGESTSLALVENIMAKDVFDAAKTGDETALRIINRAALYLGKSMATVSVILNPQRFIVGGGVSKAGDILFDAIRKHYREHTQETAQEGVDIVPAVLATMPESLALPALICGDKPGSSRPAASPGSGRRRTPWKKCKLSASW